MSDPTHADKMLDMAQRFAGWPLIEIYGVGPDGTCQCSRGKTCKSAGKHPRGEEWQTSDGLSAQALAEILRKRPRANIGTLTGEPAGFWVLDIDAAGMEPMKELIAMHGAMPVTRVHRTGGGTFHYFFAQPLDFDVTNRRGSLPKGIDARGTGGQVVLPTSRSGKGYYDVVADAPIAAAPAWLLDMVRPTGLDALEAVTNAPDDEAFARADDASVENRVGDGMVVQPLSDPADDPDSAYVPTARESAYEQTIISGEVKRLRDMTAAATKDVNAYRGDPWDQTTYMAACQLIELANADWSTITHDQAEALVRANAPRDDGFDDMRVEEKIRSAARKVGEKKRPRPVDNTSWVDQIPGGSNTPVEPGTVVAPDADLPMRGFHDVGNADRLVDRHGGQIRWAIDAETWLAYDGKRWDDDGAATIIKGLSRATIEEARRHEIALYSDAPDEFYANGEPKSSPKERFVDWCQKSLFEARMKAMVNVAQPDGRIQCKMGDFDTSTNLLNCANGVVDLRTGTMVDHEPVLMLKALAPVAYDPLAVCPLFDAFLERVQPDIGMRAYLQTVAGYSITGETSEQALFLHNGHGANGKSVFLEIIREIVGDMGQKMARDTIMSKNGQASGIPDDVASMLGGRFLIGSETAAGKKLDDERIKELVGGEAQRARHLYGKWFDFKPTGKIHIATNHLPVMESGGHGMGRRLRVIPWEVTIPDAEQDKTLKEKILATEAPGVLAWLVRGAVQWYAQGLRTPEAVQTRTDEHVEDADPLWPFVNERLQVLDPADSGGTEHAQVYQAYASWCESNGHRPMSGKAFSQGLMERLGHDVRYLATGSRRSTFRVKVNLVAVPDQHQAFFSAAH